SSPRTHGEWSTVLPARCAGTADTGHVEQDVDAAAVLLHLAQEPDETADVADVEDPVVAAQFLQPVLAPRDRDHVRAASREVQCEPPAQAGRGPGDDGYLSAIVHGRPSWGKADF